MGKFKLKDGKIYQIPVNNQLEPYTIPLDDEYNLKIIVDCLNATKAKKVIRALLKHFKPGSKHEEAALKDILAADQFIKEHS